MGLEHNWIMRLASTLLIPRDNCINVGQTVPRCFHLVKVNCKCSTSSPKPFYSCDKYYPLFDQCSLWLPGIICHMKETLKKHAHRKRCFNIAVIKLYLHFQYELGFSGMYLSPRKVSLEFQKLIKIFFGNLFQRILPISKFICKIHYKQSDVDQH